MKPLHTLAIALAVPGLVAAAAAAAPDATASTRSGPFTGLQAQANRLVADGAPGVIVYDRRGHEVAHVTAGLARKPDAAGDPGEPMRARDKVHVGSVTKTFVSVVVLQLVAEHRLSLDDSLERLLPGSVHGHGYDPAKITVRELLQQTSGLHDYVEGLTDIGQLERVWQPQELVDQALVQGPPISGWYYSNTNYVLLGMIVEKVTGHRLGAELGRRILGPLRLRDTSFPVDDPAMPRPYAHGYWGQFGDVTTRVNPSGSWAAGAIVSTVDDTARFYRALLSGRLLPPAQLREMQDVMPVDDPTVFYGPHYGLGIYRFQLPCGTAWGHDGGYPGGFKTWTYTSPDATKQVVIVWNDFGLDYSPANPTVRADVQQLTETAFCGRGNP
jgi:D-alanyl-D-alanine carboxypeptidase